MVKISARRSTDSCTPAYLTHPYDIPTAQERIAWGRYNHRRGQRRTSILRGEWRTKAIAFARGLKLSCHPDHRHRTARAMAVIRITWDTSSDFKCVSPKWRARRTHQLGYNQAQ